MNYSVEITERAGADLRAIFEYIAFELQSITNAERQLSRLEHEILSLETMPERYRRYGKEPWKSRNLRVMPVDRYCVFYIPDHMNKTIRVVRVMYGGRDVDTELAKHTE